MKIKGSGELKDCVLVFNGHDHKLNVVIAKAGSAPLIDVKVAEIDLAQSLKERDDHHAIDDLAPAVIKHAGKFLILLGRHRISRAVGLNQETIQVRLVTSVALKDARVVEVQERATSPAFNPPRWTDNKRLGANAGPSYDRTRTFDHVSDRQSRPHSAPVNERRDPNQRPFQTPNTPKARPFLKEPSPFNSATTKSFGQKRKVG